LAKMKETSKILVILGGVIGILEALLHFSGYWGPIWTYFPDPLLGLVSLIVAIIFSLIALATSGAIKMKALKMEYNFLVLLIVGAVMFVFGANLGGILVILGSILLILK
jgi:hypothetical protein